MLGSTAAILLMQAGNGRTAEPWEVVALTIVAIVGLVWGGRVIGRKR